VEIINVSQHNLIISLVKLLENSTTMVHAQNENSAVDAYPNDLLDYFLCSTQCGVMPIELNAGDKYSFLISVQPNYQLLSKKPLALPNIGKKLPLVCI
jgi:hypothetical protein